MVCHGTTPPTCKEKHGIKERKTTGGKDQNDYLTYKVVAFQ